MRLSRAPTRQSPRAWREEIHNGSVLDTRDHGTRTATHGGTHAHLAPLDAIEAPRDPPRRTARSPAPPLMPDMPRAQRRARASAVAAHGDHAPALVVGGHDADDDPPAGGAGEGDAVQRTTARGEPAAPVDEDDGAHHAPARHAADAVDQPPAR